MNFWSFWHEHAFLAWCALWVACYGAAIAAGAWASLMRTVAVIVRGHPPAPTTTSTAEKQP